MFSTYFYNLTFTILKFKEVPCVEKILIETKNERFKSLGKESYLWEWTLKEILF